MKKAFKILEKASYVVLAVAATLLLWSVLPVKNGPKLMVVLSGSMEPAIHTGSVVIVKPAGQYKVGDVITFGKNTRTEVPTTHRVVSDRIQDGVRMLQTQGDANNSPDVKEISESEVIGKVLVSVPFAGYVIDFVKKPLGFALVIALPAVFIVYDEARKIWAELKKLKKPQIEESV